MSDEARVKLCAIAKNEGAYLADWIHHHLYFGFDAIEVWVNGTTDPSMRILRRIGRELPHVSARRVDRLMDECESTGQMFQQVAYTRMARKCRREGFTHVAFLDLDEYWMPRHGTGSIKDFLPADPQVNVISFPWWNDVPDPDGTPFAPIHRSLRVQQNPHVKSVLRLDGSIRRIYAHTAQTSGGVRLLVRDPFPLVDAARQKWGSFVSDEFAAEAARRLPEAFVVHATHRTSREYVARLANGMRQTGQDADVKVNRAGYQPADAPVVRLRLPARAWRRLSRDRKAFHRRVGVARLVRRAEAVTEARTDEFIDRLQRDENLFGKTRLMLRGVRVPELDVISPGWDRAAVRWWIDGVRAGPDAHVVHGWAITEPSSVPLDVEIVDVDGHHSPCHVRWTHHPGVRQQYPSAPHDSGFELSVPDELRDQLADLRVSVRLQGATLRETRALVDYLPPEPG